MQQRMLGSTGRQVGAVGLGCMGMSWAYSPAERDERASRALLEEAVDAGVSFFDTADVYGFGANESLVGPALAPHRDRITLATKVGLIAPADGASGLARDGRPEHIHGAVRESLRRLDTDVIDLYYLHRVDERVPLAETWGAMAELVSAGLVRALGMSEVSVGQLAEAAAIHPVSAVQSEFSLWTRGPAGADPAVGDVVGWTAAHGAAFVPFAPLGRGYLTGAIAAGSFFEGNDFRATNPRFAPDALAANQRIVDTVRSVAETAGSTPAQVAIAWVLAQGEHVVPIPGTKRSAYLRDNIGAAELRLTADQLATLDALPAARGERY